MTDKRKFEAPASIKTENMTIPDVVDLTSDDEARPMSKDEIKQSSLRATLPVDSVDSDDGDEDLRRAIELSLQDEHLPLQKATRSTTATKLQPSATDRPRPEDSRTVSPVEVTETLDLINPKTASSILGMDRRTMEAERLARLKRKRDSDESRDPAYTMQPAVSIPKPVLQSRTRQTSLLPEQVNEPQTNAKAAQGAGKDSQPPRITPLSTHNHLFPGGKVLKTYCPGDKDLRSESISFEKLITPSSSIQSCLLSSFVWDFDWLFPHFDTKTTKFMLVMHSDPRNPEMHQKQLLEDFAGITNVRLCFPSMAGLINCMHSKLMLLFYENRCRVIIPTANLTSSDWGVGGVMENMLWTIDLPRKESSVRGSRINDNGMSTNFESELSNFLKAQNVANDVMERLRDFDFSNTSKIGFVHTIGGMHTDDKWQATGLCQLGRTVTQLNLASNRPIQIDYVASSIGSLNDDFMRSIYLAAKGDDGRTEFVLRASHQVTRAKHDATANSVSSTDAHDWKTRFRFYFPSHETVQNSRGGAAAAQTICFSEKWWKGAAFPRQNIRACLSVREGLLMHSKLLFVRSEATTDSNVVAWMYLGSANLSESAWGKIVHDKKTKSAKLNCRNWECGVLVPVHSPASAEESTDIYRRDTLKMFSKTVPIPILYPAPSLEGKKPWFFRD